MFHNLTFHAYLVDFELELFFAVGFDSFKEMFKGKVFFGLPAKVVGNVIEGGGFFCFTNPKASTD